jgi:hypothetical protein
VLRRTLFALAIAGSAALLSTPVPGQLTQLRPALPGFDHAGLDAVLGATVRDDGVDYALLREHHLPGLQAYLQRAAEFDIGSLDFDAQLALYINVYNASVLLAVAERHEPGYTVAAGSFELFDEPRVTLGRQRISLRHLEDEIIRRRFREPRVHAALVCAARSCPPLLPRAYRPGDLEEVLEQRMRAFVNDPQRNRILPDERRLELSRIFEWYAEDFGGRPALAAYVDRYADADVAGFSVSFLDYAWELNGAAPASP